MPQKKSHLNNFLQLSVLLHNCPLLCQPTLGYFDALILRFDTTFLLSVGTLSVVLMYNQYFMAAGRGQRRHR
jgi:hypothetical protein